MESLGKKLDRDGNIVHQGLTVYGYKGSTDQHAYMQQLRDGPANFFMTFIRIHQGRTEARFQIEPGVTLGDYLFGYLEGTRNALYERGRGSITIGLPRLDATSLGALIALYERAVGLYAEFINVNAYHQPGVDKDAGTATVALQKLVIHSLSQATAPQTAEEIANEIGQPEQVETVYKILDYLLHLPDRRIAVSSDRAPARARFWMRQTSSAQVVDTPSMEEPFNEIAINS